MATRIIDEQKANFERLQNLYENFLKERKERRTPERKKKYEELRISLWTTIEKDHKILTEAEAPKEYEKKFKEACELNAKFYEKMKTWDTKPSTSTAAEVLEEEAENVDGENFDTSLKDLQDSRELDDQTVKMQRSVPQQVVDEPLNLSNSTRSTTMSSSQITQSAYSANVLLSSGLLAGSTTHAQNRLSEDMVPRINNQGVAPMPEKMSWNQQIQQEQNLTSGSLEKILMLLAQNQLQQTSMKPVQVELQPYDGNVTNFKAFKDSFARTIRNSTSWSSIDLFIYLKSKLTGVALESIKKLEVSEETYNLAWEILEKRFNNKRQRLEYTMQMLKEENFRTEPDQTNTFTSFVNTYQNVRVNIKQLKATTDDLLMELVMARMDDQTKGRFEDFIGKSTTTPTFDQLDDFFEKESMVCRNKRQSTNTTKPKIKVQPSTSKVHITQDMKGQLECFLCSKNHLATDCDIFLSTNDRERLLRKNHICIYCVAHKYDRKSPCQKRKNLKCDICNGKHLTLMHRPESSRQVENAPEQINNAFLTQDSKNSFTLLPTAVANILDFSGQQHQVRCLIDLCAERSYICEDLVQKMKLKKMKTRVTIAGINGISGKSTASVNLVIALDNSQNLTTNALVVPKVTGCLPSVEATSMWQNFDLTFADPFFYKPSFVGVLLGSDVAVKLFRDDVPNKITTDGLLLQPTHLGWIVSGSSAKPKDYVSTFVTLNETISKINNEEEISKRILDFYELPETEDDSASQSNDLCEQAYQEKHYRLEDGRYVVPIPWICDGPTLGHSYRKALQMFIGQEKKWCKNKEHYTMSNKFMTEYEALGHMSRLNAEEERNDSNEVYYIPYMSILRHNSLTTKLRNVFNASMASSNGVSLNDTMWEGPKLQTHIKDIILTARSFKYIYGADVSMMFRQILIRPEDRDKLRIIWRPTPNEPPREYKLNTVTYGTDSAPYLAIRTLHQCAKDNSPSPDIERIIRNGFYVDDLLYGAQTIEDCKRQVAEIITTMNAGKFPLTKWFSNDTETLSEVNPHNRIESFLEDDSKDIKLLGMNYNYADDYFQLKYKQPANVKATKRGISSAAASFFDPIGFILPFIMMLRILLQNVWRQKVDWDENIPDKLQENFDNCIRGLESLNNIRIPRFIPSDENGQVEFIGFSDASSQAQAGVIYSRIKSPSGYNVTLVTARGNVAKIKTVPVVDSKQCTIPKLELQALVTLAEMFQHLRSCFSHLKVKFTAYTDSQVVLAWVRSQKVIRNKFVSRRVEKIRSVLEPKNIHYVKTDENPADPASRGLTAENLAACDLWFKGPSWLQQEELPSTPFTSAAPLITTLITMTPDKDDMFSRFSRWSTLLRVVAYCLRWKRQTKTGFLKSADIAEAKQRLISFYQHLHLPEVFQALLNQKTVPRRHWLHNLTPFIDDKGLIRVGGRLGNARHIRDPQKHPIVIPKGTCQKLLIEYTHKVNMCAIHSLTSQILVSEYWIPGIKAEIKSCINRCVRCIRWRAKNIQPQMSQLPEERITPSNTFDKIGVDLSGPYSIKASPLRFDRKMKIWVVHFVCMVTKASHLELLTSLSAEHFIAAFTRFCCRRGTSSEVWSDNGTNFVGTSRLLRETWEQVLKQCEERTAIQEVTWKFIPRHSPTFGGLWEANVKSMKYFLKRMMDVPNLTYEEFETLICRIEALLNSRPLYANPLTPHDDPALTPFHFINQRGFKPTSIDGCSKVPLTKKWLMIMQIQKQFWHRFQMEYLKELQAKTKWQKPQKNLAVNDVVLIKEPSTTPGNWKLAQVVNTYPDPQGTVRKVDVRTAATKESTLHAVNRLVPLLTEQEDTQTQPRRSSRHNNVSLIHLCLLVILAVSPIVKSEAVEPLQAGTHVRRLGEIYMKSFDLEFPVITNLNLTADIEVSKSCVEHFSADCQRHRTSNPEAYNQCMSFLTSLQNLSDQVIKKLTTQYNQQKRSKRWLQLTTKGLWKAAPTVLTSVGMIYQEVQISKLQTQLAQTKENMRNTANVLLKVQDLEYEAVAGKLNEVIQQQSKLQLAEAVNEYAEQITLLLRRIKDKYDEVTLIQPIDELNQYTKRLFAEVKNIGLPDIGGEIFRTTPPTQELNDNGIITIKFTIPIVTKPMLTHWLLLSVPTDTGHLSLFDNNNKFQRIVVHPLSNKSADITEHHAAHPNILEDITLTPMSDCTKTIFFKLSTPDQHCKQETLDTVYEEVVQVSPSTVVVYTSKSKIPLKITCDSTNFTINSPAAILHENKCRSHPSSYRVQNGEERAVTSVESLLGVEPLTQSAEILETKGALLNQWIPKFNEMNSGSITATVLGTITVVFLVGIISRYLPRRQSSQDLWLPHWESPRRTI